MRALFLAHSFPRFAGDLAGAFVLHLAQALAGEGIQVEVLAPGAPGLLERQDLGGIVVHRFRYAPRRYETLAYGGNMADLVRTRWTGRLALLTFLAAARRAVAQCRRAFEPDVLHAHWWFPGGLVATLPGALKGLPLVTTLHGTDVRIARDVHLARPLFRRVVRRSSAVTAVSSWLAEEAQRLAPTVRPVVAPMPVATELFEPASDDIRPRSGVLFVGRLTAQKGVDRLLRALRHVQHAVTLDVVGDGAERPRLEALAGELGLSERVRWHGTLPQHHLRERYAAAELLVIPSHEEGLGLVAVEGMLCGTPVIAFDSGGLRDLVHHERTGLLVAEGAGEVERLGAAIEALLGDGSAGRRSTIGAQARRHALDTFAPHAVARRYAAIYRQVTGGRP